MLLVSIDGHFVQKNPSIKTFSRLHNATRIILILLVICTIILIHLEIFFNKSTGRCIAMPARYAIYSLIVIGILPLLLMILFSLLTWHNLQMIRSRLVPTGLTIRNRKIHKRDRALMRVLSVEVFAYCWTTLPYPINLIYSVSTSSIEAYKSPIHLAIEPLIGYIISFWINLMYFLENNLWIYFIYDQETRNTMWITLHTTHQSTRY